MKTVIRRLADLETAVLAAKRSTAEGLIALLDRGQLTLEQLTDGELERIVDPAWQPVMRQLTEDELVAIISGVEKANPTADEQAAIDRFIELAEEEGLPWAA